MDLRELEAFQAVVETGSVAHAARRLHRAQSSVTARIHRLESSLGVTLFHREGSRLRLTARGEALVEHAERLLELAERTRSVVRNDDVAGRIRLGAMESVAASRLAFPLAEFHRRYPEVWVNLQVSSSRDLVSDVQAGVLDAAIVGDDVNPGYFRSVPLYEEKLVLVGARGSPALDDLHRLATGSILVYHRPGCILRRRLERWLDSQRIVPARVLEFASFHGTLAAVAGGVGIAMVPHSVLEVFPQRNVLSTRDLPPKQAHFQTGLIAMRNRHYPASTKLEECLQSDALAKRGPAKPRLHTAERRRNSIPSGTGRVNGTASES